MMNTKKFLFLFLCACLVVCSGCGKSPVESKVEEPPVTEEPVEEWPFEEPPVDPNQTLLGDGIWESVPNTFIDARYYGEPTITLNVDSVQGMIYVNTFPKTVDLIYYSEYGVKIRYLTNYFDDGVKIKYLMRGDYFCVYNPDIKGIDIAYIRDFQSVDSMVLKATGVATAFDQVYFPRHLFIRKTFKFNAI